MTTFRHLLERTVGACQEAALLAMPHGGQRRARTNAWAEVQTGVGRRADRRTAARAIEDLRLAMAEPPSYAAAR
jgi:hypothetical protein